MEGPCKTAIKRGTPAHQYVIEYFNGNKGEKSNRRRLQIAQNLIRMREERRMADYNNEVHILKKLHDKAQFVLDQSEEVVDLIEKGGLQRPMHNLRISEGEFIPGLKNEFVDFIDRFKKLQGSGDNI